MPPPPSARAAARAAATALGGTPQVHPFYDDDESTRVTVLSCADAPSPGWSSYSTVDLHLTPNLMDGKDIRVELAGVAGAGVEGFDNMIATAAFYVMKNGWLAAPGVLFEGIAHQYDLSEKLVHVMWVEPFPWEADLGSFQADDDLTVHWLLAIPISESERRFLDEKGFYELEDLFAEREIDYFDLAREPVV